MPYIQTSSRPQYDQLINDLTKALCHNKDEAIAGDINYVISSVLWKIFNKKKNYATANNLIGVLECIKLELYRRQIAPYEDIKTRENGDIDEL